ncbi:MAG: hypothetical protein QM820_47920 [Minicystis sp.]
MFQAAGYFVEKNIRQRDVTDVLELDAVATSYDGPLPESVLAEAKGGRWGFPDIFKVAGWMAYLGIERGGFFVKEPPGGGGRDVEQIANRVARMGVALVDLGDFEHAAERLGAGGFRPLRDPGLLDIWRLAFGVERALLDGVRAERRARAEQRGAHAVLLYHDLINDHVFFLKDVDERLRRLYAAYRCHPKLSLAIAGELAGGPFAEGAKGPLPPAAARLLGEAMYAGKHPLLQGSFYVEHRARLAILKAAIDLACLDDAGQLPGEAFAALPGTFRAGLRRLRARPTFRRYALLWQVFLWGFGGFYRADREAEEFGALSEQTGVPRAEIGAALRAFDDLFPLAGTSWIVPARGTSLRVAKMVPAALRGVGAVQRLRRAGARNYDGLGLGPLGRRNLITWHNALVRLLAESAAKKPSS